MLVCHQHDVCKHYVGTVDVGGHGGLSESGHRTPHEPCPVSFPAVGENPSVLPQPVVMSYVNCGDYG